MKIVALLLALFAFQPARAAIISSIQRLDEGGTTPQNSLFHSTSPLFPTFSRGYPVWNDYTFQFRSVPDYLLGADQVRTRYSADSRDADFQLLISLSVPATVFLIIDDRVTNVSETMPWLSSLGFKDTGDNAVIQVSDNSVLTTASIYSGSFPAGDLILLPQHDTTGSSAMYTVAAVPEPTSAALILSGIAFAFRRRNRPARFAGRRTLPVGGAFTNMHHAISF